MKRRSLPAFLVFLDLFLDLVLDAEGVDHFLLAVPYGHLCHTYRVRDLSLCLFLSL